MSVTDLRVDGRFVGTADGNTRVPVSVSGSSLLIGATTFQVDGRVLHGLAAARPTAAAAHAALPFAYYNAVDTQALSQTDSTNWQVV